MAQATRWNDGSTIEYTPLTDLAEGAVVAIGNSIAVADRPIAANVQGTLFFNGVYDIVKLQVAIARGDDIHWNATGNPLGGVAGSGAANNTGVGIYAGRCVMAAGINDTTVRVRILDNGEGIS